MELSTKDFTYYKKSKTFITEVSTLRRGFGNQFDLVSEKTGEVVEFFQTNVEKNVDGEVENWNFKSINYNKQFFAIIFND